MDLLVPTLNFLPELNLRYSKFPLFLLLSIRLLTSLMVDVKLTQFKLAWNRDLPNPSFIIYAPIQFIRNYSSTVIKHVGFSTLAKLSCLLQLLIIFRSDCA